MKNKGWRKESARHSLAAKGVSTSGLTKLKTPLYHATSPKNAISIRKYGIQPGKSKNYQTPHLGDYEGYVFLAKEPALALMFGIDPTFDQYCEEHGIKGSDKFVEDQSDEFWAEMLNKVKLFRVEAIPESVKLEKDRFAPRKSLKVKGSIPFEAIRELDTKALVEDKKEIEVND